MNIHGFSTTGMLSWFITSCNMGKCSVSGFINMVVRRDTILKDKCEGDVSFNMGLPAITNNARIALHVDVETVQLPWAFFTEIEHALGALKFVARVKSEIQNRKILFPRNTIKSAICEIINQAVSGDLCLSIASTASFHARMRNKMPIKQIGHGIQNQMHKLGFCLLWSNRKTAERKIAVSQFDQNFKVACHVHWCPRKQSSHGVCLC